jgi:phosphotransferase system enzyme I (PtsP)
MVGEVAEFDAAQAIVGRELAHLSRHGYTPPRGLKLGVMIEVPSLLFQLDELLRRVDFVSVGSNDLLQYLYAADRDNKRVSTRFDPLSPAMLRALKAIADAAKAASKPLTLCGEIGGRPLEAMALIALGYRSLSMSATSLGPVKAMVRELDVGDVTRFVTDLLAARHGQPSLRLDLRAYADQHEIPL